MARYDVDRAELTALLDDQPRYRVDQVWHGLYRELADPETLTVLPAALRRRLGEAKEMAPALHLVTRREADRGKTVKWLWQLSDGARIETVLMEYRDRATVCVSSQAGCAMGCGFCATGQAGFRRNLSVGEIVEQVVRAGVERSGNRPSNVVFMGMGEPLSNYRSVWTAVERLNTELGISARHLTISTVGIIPGIRRLAREDLPVNLAVSLHAANDQLRDRLVPINRRYPLLQLMDACREYIDAKGRRLSFEWAMIEDVNDGPADAAELAEFALALRAHVNLIPLNPTPGWGAPPSPSARVQAFRDRLVSLGVNATVRRNRGTDIDAACGQLAADAGTMVS